MIRLKQILSIFFILTTIAALAQSPTWSSDIAPLFYKNCTSCHHTGGIAPFSLMEYTQVFNRKSSVLAAVRERDMPPWPPDENYRKHAFSRAMAQKDIDKIKAWVEAGALPGDLSKAPTAPVYDNLGFIKNPDLEITTPKYTLNSTVDEYRCFPDSTRLTKDMWMTALECIPGNPEIVHHILIFRDKGTRSFTLDNREAGPGYICFGGAGTSDAELLAAWVPGSGPFSLPKGFGMKIPAKSNIIIQIHYPGNSKGKSDQTKIKFRLTDVPQRETFLVPALNHQISMVNGPLVIPANTVKTFNQQFLIPLSFSLIGVAPHMHLIGTSIKTWAVDPAQKEIPLVNIPHWDFHWQGIYQFPKIVRLPAGSMLHSEATYNNTRTNHHNPNNPPVEVKVGEATTDEMMLTYFLFSIYQNGDENIIIDTAAALLTGIKPIEHHQNAMQLYPNPLPSNNRVNVLYTTSKKETIKLELIDVHGRIVYAQKNIALTAGQNALTIPGYNLSPGLYTVKLETSDKIITDKLIVNE